MSWVKSAIGFHLAEDGVEPKACLNIIESESFTVLSSFRSPVRVETGVPASRTVSRGDIVNGTDATSWDWPFIRAVYELPAVKPAKERLENLPFVSEFVVKLRINWGVPDNAPLIIPTKSDVDCFPDGLPCKLTTPDSVGPKLVAITGRIDSGAAVGVGEGDSIAIFFFARSVIVFLPDCVATVGGVCSLKSIFFSPEAVL